MYYYQVLLWNLQQEQLLVLWSTSFLQYLHYLFRGDFPTLGLDAFNTTAEINALRDILLYHVIPGQVLDRDLTASSVAKVFTGNFITVVASGNTSVIRDTTTNTTDAGITATNILATNGVAHVINQVFVPLSAFNILH
jgi:uncharacterized surface protein with fasciclin (FAS1) repeats